MNALRKKMEARREVTETRQREQQGVPKVENALETVGALKYRCGDRASGRP
jgi:hypothetical protein